MPTRTQLPYQRDSAQRFAGIANQPWSQWLDSASHNNGDSRYDILVFDPRVRLVFDNGSIQVDDQTPRACDDPLQYLRDQLGPVQPSPYPDLPFVGGAVGYWSYDLGWWLTQWGRDYRAAGDWPQMAVGIYDQAVVVDHQRQQSWYVSLDDNRSLPSWLDGGERPVHPSPFRAECTVRTTLEEGHYQAGFERIQTYLRAGDCYQVNYTRQFAVDVDGDPFAAYCLLRQRNAAPFAAYLNFPFGQVLSASPERFLKVEQGWVETCPIKGTRPRFDDPEADRVSADALRQSRKDRAENLMIVDLLRNDLGKCCELGSVKTPELFALHSFASVHHLISTVTGQLRADCDALALLGACFPGGSITGAPKRRAMEIINELEPVRRELYCGAIGYIGFNGDMDCNIVIRTALHQNGQLKFSAGGGIVVDSDVEQEYAESQFKAARLFDLITNH